MMSRKRRVSSVQPRVAPPSPLSFFPLHAHQRDCKDCLVSCAVLCSLCAVVPRRTLFDERTVTRQQAVLQKIINEAWENSGRQACLHTTFTANPVQSRSAESTCNLLCSYPSPPWLGRGHCLVHLSFLAGLYWGGGGLFLWLSAALIRSCHTPRNLHCCQRREGRGAAYYLHCLLHHCGAVLTTGSHHRIIPAGFPEVLNGLDRCLPPTNHWIKLLR